MIAFGLWLPVAAALCAPSASLDRHDGTDRAVSAAEAGHHDAHGGHASTATDGRLGAPHAHRSADDAPAAPAGHHGTDGPGGADCVYTMACGGVAHVAVPIGMLTAGAASYRMPATHPVAPSSLLPQHETPPPRLTV